MSRFQWFNPSGDPERDQFQIEAQAKRERYEHEREDRRSLHPHRTRDEIAEQLELIPGGDGS